MTDTELVAKTLAGDMHALQGADAHAPPVCFTGPRAPSCATMPKRKSASRSYCSRAFRALATFRGESKLSTWLVRITANEALMRRRANVKAAGRMDIEPDDLASAEAGPETTAQGEKSRAARNAHRRATRRLQEGLHVALSRGAQRGRNRGGARGPRDYRAHALFPGAQAPAQVNEGRGHCAFKPGHSVADHRGGSQAAGALQTARGAAARDRPRQRRHAQSRDPGGCRYDEHPGLSTPTRPLACIST